MLVTSATDLQKDIVEGGRVSWPLDLGCSHNTDMTDLSQLGAEGLAMCKSSCSVVPVAPESFKIVSHNATSTFVASFFPPQCYFNCHI